MIYSSLTKLTCAAAAFAAVVSATPATAGPLITDWYASGGTPASVSPAWVLSGSGSSLAGGVLTIRGKTYWGQYPSTPGFNSLQAFSVEARLRVLSNSSSLDSREGTNIVFAQGPTNGNALFIGNGRIFINNGDVSRGSTAFVDTADFHTYRIDVGAPAVVGGLSTISVSYDGVTKLTGSTFSSVPFSGYDQRFFFGGGSSYASGVSEWQFVRNSIATAAAVPEPASWAMLVAGFTIVGTATRRRRHSVAA